MLPILFTVVFIVLTIAPIPLMLMAITETGR